MTIDAPVEAVWPWLAQLGQDRGGLYGYEWLENLAGCRMRNAHFIMERKMLLGIKAHAERARRLPPARGS